MDIKKSYNNGIFPPELKIIDAHGHLGSYNGVFLRKLSLEQSIKFSKSLGISKMCVSSITAISSRLQEGNRELFEVIDKYPDTILGYVFYNARFEKESILEIEKYINHPNFIGVKIHPRDTGVGLLSNKYQKLWEYGQKYNFVILCHTWENEPENNPDIFFDILKKYSSLKIFIGHAGGTYNGYETCYRLVKEYPHVYIDLNGFLYSKKWIEQVVEETDINRLLFSTDQVFNDPRIALGRIVLSSLSDSQKIKILYDNFNTIMASTHKEK
jgi:predicted TIM-barrel fold metal-dependent hydrolase